MEAPIASIAAFAPRSWISKLPLESFNAWSWLWRDLAATCGRVTCPRALGHLLKPSLSAALDMMGAPDTWRWPAEWPSGAEIQVRSCCLSDDDAKAAHEALLLASQVTITAQLRCALLELVYCRAVCRLKKGSLRVPLAAVCPNPPRIRGFGWAPVDRSPRMRRYVAVWSMARAVSRAASPCRWPC